jgi:hypothetical protein
MNSKDIEAGHFYFNEGEWLVREARIILPDGLIHWRDFAYPEGKPFGSGACSHYRFAKWAKRELTSAEIAKLQIKQADENENHQEEELRYLALMQASDEELFAELEHRGFKFPLELKSRQ